MNSDAGMRGLFESKRPGNRGGSGPYQRIGPQRLPIIFIGIATRSE
jgi:hypothetical protein